MKGKKKINILDVIIVIFVVGVVLGATALVQSFAGDSVSETKTVVVEATQLKESFCNILKTGEIAYDGVQNVKLGEVIDYEIKPCEKDSVSVKDGTIKRVKVPERYDVLITVEIPAETEIVVGKQMWLETSIYKCSGYVLEINEQA